MPTLCRENLKTIPTPLREDIETKLTPYNGQAISYDASGNPTSYKGDTVTWNGRLMTSYTNSERHFEYAYNSDGMRTLKKVYENGELVYTEIYVWDGDVLLANKIIFTDGKDPVTARYLYDESGELYGMDYNGMGIFAYLKNLQGDIVSIISLGEDDSTEVQMEYDAWGKPIFKQGSNALGLVLIALVNSVSYRGYFYDYDTGLYYLRSRYYDPETGRFINADDTAYLGYDASPLSMNLFVYCENNPVNSTDFFGFWASPTRYGSDYSPKLPNMRDKDDYYYNPSVKSTASDKLAWAAYKAAAYSAVLPLPYGGKFFKHYLSNTGRSIRFDYSVAISNDESIRKTIKKELKILSTYIEMRKKETDYEMIGDRYFMVSCSSLDWKFALNVHYALICAQVEYNNKMDRYIVTVVITSYDLYNFSKTNRFMGVYVRKPGRFETLGWAKSFYTYGVAIYRLNWARGNYDSTVWIKNYTPSNLYRVM